MPESCALMLSMFNGYDWLAVDFLTHMSLSAGFYSVVGSSSSSVLRFSEVVYGCRACLAMSLLSATQCVDSWQFLPSENCLHLLKVKTRSAIHSLRDPQLTSNQWNQPGVGECVSRFESCFFGLWACGRAPASKTALIYGINCSFFVDLSVSFGCRSSEFVEYSFVPVPFLWSVEYQVNTSWNHLIKCSNRGDLQILTIFWQKFGTQHHKKSPWRENSNLDAPGRERSPVPILRLQDDFKRQYNRHFHNERCLTVCVSLDFHNMLRVEFSSAFKTFICQSVNETPCNAESPHWIPS